MNLFVGTVVQCTRADDDVYFDRCQASFCGVSLMSIDDHFFLCILNIVLLFMCIDTTCCESQVGGQQESDVKSLRVCLTFCR